MFTTGMDYLCAALAPSLKRSTIAQGLHQERILSIRTKVSVAMAYLGSCKFYLMKPITIFMRITVDSYAKLDTYFALSMGSCFNAVNEVIAAIFNELGYEMRFPWHIEQNREAIKQGFMRRHNVPGVLGAVDGSHIPICKSFQGESDPYYNRKKFMSIVLMAVADSDKRFLWADCRDPGSYHDSHVFKDTAVYYWMSTFGDRYLAKGSEFLIGDSAFALNWFTMKAPDNRSTDYQDHVHSKKACISRAINGSACVLCRIMLIGLCRGAELH